MRGNLIRVWLAVVMALLTGAVLEVAAPAGSASAAAADCAGGKNGFIDISDSLRGTHALPAKSIGFGVTVHLYYGTVAGAQRGWAMIDGSTISADQVWLDWSTNGGASVKVRCGPFTVGGKATKTSAAKTTSSSASYKFRACGLPVGGSTVCTGWW